MDAIKETLNTVARFFDTCRYGCQGNEGYRKSTDLHQMIACAEHLRARELIHPHATRFLDLGCADGRVNLLMSYFVKDSIGIEIDEEILSEYGPRKAALDRLLLKRRLEPFPENIHLFAGNSLEPETHERIRKQTGTALEDVDLFYTYITLHDVFGEMIAEKAGKGALYMVYGFSRILPRYDGLELLIPDVGSQGIVALYRKL